MAETKAKMLEKVHQYLSESCDSKGFPKSNLSQDEREGIRQVKKKINEREIVVFPTNAGELLELFWSEVNT